MTPATIAAVLLVVVLGFAAVVMVPAYLRQRVTWKRTPAGYYYQSIGDVDVMRLERNIGLSFALLREHSDFDPATLDAARAAAHIIVQRVNEWFSPAHGGNVAGVTTGTTIDVGQNLAALCHELAHVCEWIEGGDAKQDMQHVTWVHRGIQAAVDEYERDWVRA